MISLLEMILMGIWATLFMDATARLLSKAGIIRPQIKPYMIGRWTLYMLRGKFFHEDISKTPELSNELSTALLAHYLIGIVLAGVYLLLEATWPTVFYFWWMPLLFGTATTVFPWFWLFPAIGVGFIASKASDRSPYIVASLINHLDFGLGFLLWIVVFRRFLE